MPRHSAQHVDDPEAVGRRLRDAREDAGVSQRALAFPGCSPAYISRLESGERTPSLQVLRELGRRLGVSEDYLATGRTYPRARALVADADVALRLDDTEESKSLYERALAEAEDAAVRADALEGLGQIAFREGEPSKAIELLEQALETLGVDACARPALAESLARAHASLGALAPAIAVLEECAARYEREGDVLQHVRFASLLGAALTDNGDYAAAERIVAKALVAGRGIADPYARARLYWSESRLLLEQGQSDSAERYARRTLETLRATEDSYAIGHALEVLAHIHLDLERPAEALELLREGWPLIASAGTPIEIARFRIEEARALAALGEREDAAAIALEVAAELGNAQPLDSGRAYVLLAEIYEDVGDKERARELYEVAVERLEQQMPSRQLVIAYKRLAALLREEGRAEEALDLFERALGVQERAGRSLA